jgi:Type VI secretion system/phage-baseplate injector OB domain
MSAFESRVRGEIANRAPVQCQQYFGKYRGVVVNNLDLERRNRIQAIVPDISNVIPTTWAEACAPPGHAYTPTIGQGVWIEFEQGDPDYPIWTGCIAGSNSTIDVPLAAAFTPPGVPQTTLAGPVTQHSITVSDSPTTGITMKTPGVTMITMTDAGGILITNGVASISLIGPTVTVSGNLVVI